KAAAEEVAQISGDEWNPEAKHALFQFESLADEVDREPFRDQKPVRIKQRAADHDAPCLRVAQQLAPADRGGIGRLAAGALALSNVRQFVGTEPRMFVWEMVEVPPGHDPKKAQTSRDHEGRPPGAKCVMEPDHQK